jgi:NADPH:quinone reductase
VRAVLCSSFGPLSQLTVEERESPPLTSGQVRIAVSAAGVNFVDGLFVQGLYQIKPPLPFVPGSEVAGRVVEVAPDVTTPAVDDRVFCSVGLGGYASEVVVPAWFALVRRARAQAGQTLLVLGAGGGVGLAAVDVGSALGLRVIAAASTADKRDIARGRGAAETIDTSTEDVKTRARELAGGDGVDLVYDPVGGTQGEQALRALREDGQFVVIGFASGEIPKLPANQILLRNRRVTGVDWGAWVGRNVAENEAMLDDVVAAIERGELQPVEPASYPLGDAARAMQDQLDRRVTGKAVLVPDAG